MFLTNLICQSARRRPGQDFRKQLGVYSYKLKKIGYHKKPGLIPLRTKEELKSVMINKQALLNNINKQGLIINREIKRMELNTKTPFLGEFRGSKFVFDQTKMHNYIVPDLTGFNLKPYVSVHVPKIDKTILQQLKALNDFNNPLNFERYKDLQRK